MSDELRTLREASVAIKGVHSTLRFVFGTLTVAATILSAAIGGLYLLLFQVRGELSELKSLPEETKLLDQKVSSLDDRLSRRLDGIISDLSSIKAAVKAANTPGVKEINAYAFADWVGVPITNFKVASQLLVRYLPSEGQAWLYSTNTAFVKSLAAEQPQPTKLVLDADAFSGWYGIPVTDPKVAAKAFQSYDAAAGPVWLYSKNLDFTQALTSLQKR